MAAYGALQPMADDVPYGRRCPKAAIQNIREISEAEAGSYWFLCKWPVASQTITDQKALPTNCLTRARCRLFHLLKITGLPGSIEGRSIRAVQAEVDEPAACLCRVRVAEPEPGCLLVRVVG